MDAQPRTAVLVCADAEWRAVVGLLPRAQLEPSPAGQWFLSPVLEDRASEPVLFFNAGWGKIQAAASTQYVIDRWSPDLIVNLGTCGGFQGEINKGDVILASRTVVYDIHEEMADPQAHIAHYTTDLDLSWLAETYPQKVIRTTLVSADRDIRPEDIAWLKEQYGAVAGDWESGAIAFVAARNATKCLILRGVTDTVGSTGSDAYGDYQAFVKEARTVMAGLVRYLPYWLGGAFHA